MISVHWSWACDRLSPAATADLVAWTEREIRVANLTI